MNNNKQSSIEWLCERLALKLGTPMAISFYIDHAEEIEQAKAMRKQELELAFKGGMSLVEGHLWKPIDKFEEFYNETFN